MYITKQKKVHFERERERKRKRERERERENVRDPLFFCRNVRRNVYQKGHVDNHPTSGAGAPPTQGNP